MQRYQRSVPGGKLWYLTTANGGRETIATIQKRITRLQCERGFFAYSAWCFETRPKLHAHFIFVGDTTMRKKLEQAAFGPFIRVREVYDLNKLLCGYHAKERTPQAGWSRERQLGWRVTGSHRLEGGGDRVRLSRQLERDAVEDGWVAAWLHTNAKRSSVRKQYRRRR
jgi:hypothetical protein